MTEEWEFLVLLVPVHVSIIMSRRVQRSKNSHFQYKFHLHEMAVCFTLKQRLE